MPPLPAYGNHLLEYLYNMGIADWDRPHNYSNLSSWCSVTGMVLSAWEIETMCLMSQSFFSALQDPDAPPPYDTESSRARRLSGLRETLSRKIPPKE